MRERQSGVVHLCLGPDAERLDDLAAEQRREMIALGEDGQTDRRAEPASDIGNRIGVPSSTGKLAGAGDSRCQTTLAPSPTPSGAAA